ncbi:MAG: hypothetical protein WC227_01935 [Patescibacteria group bacterium]|jgi:hypothetical protein
MITTVHVISGGLLGESIGDPFLAFAAGIILHFILDAIPHFDNLLEDGEWTWKQWVFTSADLLLMTSLLIFLKPELSLSSPFLWGAFGGLLPDILDNVPFWRKKFRSTYFGGKLRAFHQGIHPKGKQSVFWGAITQIAALTLFYFLSR